MSAGRVNHFKDHQVCVSEKTLCFRSRCFGSSRQPAQVLVLYEAPQMVEANTCDVRDFVFGEQFLTRLDSNHRHTPHVLRCLHEIRPIAFLCNNRSVSSEGGHLRADAKRAHFGRFGRVRGMLVRGGKEVSCAKNGKWKPSVEVFYNLMDSCAGVASFVWPTELA